MAWATFTLTRLRRLARPGRPGLEVLDAALLRRAELAAALAREQPGDLGPRSAADLAAAAARCPRPERRRPGAAAENRLGRLLRRVPEPVLQRPSSATPESASALARRFYNDAVRDTRELRGAGSPGAAAARPPAAAAVLRHRRRAGRRARRADPHGAGDGAPPDRP